MRATRSISRYVFIVLSLMVILRTVHWLRHTNTSRLTVVKSRVDWSQYEFYHPLSSLAPIPKSKTAKLRRIQHQFTVKSHRDTTIQSNRRKEVRAVFEKCWNNYKQHAWMRDELEPLTGGAKDTFGGWAATLVDSLDTLWIMGFKDEFEIAAKAAVAIDWSNTTESAVNLFETNIRYLGGLLSAYDLSQEPAILAKATELGHLLYAGLDTPNHMPPFWLDFEKAKRGALIPDDHEPSAVPGSLSLEFTRLAQLTRDDRYYDAIDRISELLCANQNLTLLPGMWPAFFDMKAGTVTGDNSFTLGALADSLYEYLPKMYALISGLDDKYQIMYRGAAETAKQYLLFRPMTPENADILFTGTVHVNGDNEAILSPEGQHLSCFTGGFFALGGRLFDIPEHVEIGARLARGCAWAYQAFPTGVMPEIFSMSTCYSLDGCQWDEEKWRRDVSDDPHGHDNLPKGFKNAREPKYILRPEAIESVFLLYRITGREEFQEVAWDMFRAIQKATEAPYGNAALVDVTVTGKPEQANSMESFWLAETLKYFYLIFSPPDYISLDEWVLNTEAHPFRLATT